MFRFNWEKDMLEEEGDTKRTTREVTKAMSAIVSFSEFTGEDRTMFKSCKLPTLDIEIWEEQGNVNYVFYKKTNSKVLLADTT